MSEDKKQIIGYFFGAIVIGMIVGFILGMLSYVAIVSIVFNAG